MGQGKDKRGRELIGVGDGNGGAELWVVGLVVNSKDDYSVGRNSKHAVTLESGGLERERERGNVIPLDLRTCWSHLPGANGMWKVTGG